MDAVHARVIGRLEIGEPQVAVRRAASARSSVRRVQIARRAQIARRVQIAPIIRAAQPATLAIGRLVQAARGRGHKLRGQVANNVRIAAAATTTGVARAGLRRCAGAVDGTSRLWLRRALRRVAWLRRPRGLNPHRRPRRS
jgi:hypothetical protein